MALIHIHAVDGDDALSILKPLFDMPRKTMKLWSQLPRFNGEGETSTFINVWSCERKNWFTKQLGRICLMQAILYYFWRENTILVHIIGIWINSQLETINKIVLNFSLHIIGSWINSQLETINKIVLSCSLDYDYDEL